MHGVQLFGLDWFAKKYLAKPLIPSNLKRGNNPSTEPFTPYGDLKERYGKGIKDDNQMHILPYEGDGFTKTAKLNLYRHVDRMDDVDDDTRFTPNLMRAYGTAAQMLMNNGHHLDDQFLHKHRVKLGKLVNPRVHMKTKLNLPGGGFMSALKKIGKGIKTGFNWVHSLEIPLWKKKDGTRQQLKIGKMLVEAAVGAATGGAAKAATVGSQAAKEIAKKVGKRVGSQAMSMFDSKAEKDRERAKKQSKRDARDVMPPPEERPTYTGPGFDAPRAGSSTGRTGFIKPGQSFKPSAPKPVMTTFNPGN